MNKTYEILPEGQVKIISEVTTTEEKVVDISAVQKRVDELNQIISDSQKELSEWTPLLESINKGKVDAVIPEAIVDIPQVEVIA